MAVDSVTCAGAQALTWIWFQSPFRGAQQLVATEQGTLWGVSNTLSASFLVSIVTFWSHSVWVSVRTRPVLNQVTLGQPLPVSVTSFVEQGQKWCLRCDVVLQIKLLSHGVWPKKVNAL